MINQEKHRQNFERIKQGSYYFDQEQYQLDKLKYYFDNDVDPFNTDYEKLHHLLSTTFKHARRRENFFTSVDRHPDFTLRCVYSGKILSNSEGELISKANQEHSFPQSFQRGSKAGTGRDMHSIFASESSANGSRGNTPFGNKGKLIEENECGGIYIFEGKKYFQPRINAGALARASLYVLVCYKGCANPNYLPLTSLQWMVETAKKQPLTYWQLHRNHQLFRLQGNRNPFIDFPQLAGIIDFKNGWQQQ